QSIREQMQAQMQSLQQAQNHGSPAPNHLTPQQQATQLAQAQQRMMAAQAAQAQAQAQQMMGAGLPLPQQRGQLTPQLQQLYQNTFSAYMQRFISQAAAKYGGNATMLQPHEMQQVQTQAKNAAAAQVRKHQNQMQQQAQMRQQQGGGL